MKKKSSLALLFLILCVIDSTEASLAQAQKSASPTSVKIGYFNLDIVKASYPASAESETLKSQAEAQLRRDVDDANKALQKMQMDKRPTEEVQKAQHDTQIAIDAEQSTLIKMIQRQSAVVKERILQAANKVAKDKGLDLIVDGAGVFAGGKTVLDTGIDVTKDVSRLLGTEPATASGTAHNQAASGSAPDTATATQTSLKKIAAPKVQR